MSRLSRAATAAVCCLTLALPARAAASDEDLTERASEHVVKAIRLFNSGDYASSEAEFKRAEFFAPKWRVIHFNLAVVAEAQGKLGIAIKEYEKFKPDASPDEDELVNQRLFELNDRRKKIAGAYKQNIALGAGAMAIGVAALGAGGTLLAIGLSKPKTVESGTDSTDNTTRTKLLYGGYIGLIAGVVIVVYSIIPLKNSVKAKRQLDGLAIGPTRLKWNGGMGATLRF